MAVWLVRAGAKGEHEHKFLTESRVYLTKRLLNYDIGCLADRAELITVMSDLYETDKARKIINLASQAWAFGRVMALGDLVVLPSKFEPVIYLGKIESGYQYQQAAENPYYHWRAVKWQQQPIVKAELPDELRRSFSAAMTICQLKKDNAVALLQQLYG